MAAKIRKGDKVVILSGRDKGKKGDVSMIVPKKGKAVVSGVNMVTRHTKQTQTTQGGKIAKEMPLDISNLALVDPKEGVATRVGFKIIDGKKVRFAKKSGELIND